MQHIAIRILKAVVLFFVMYFSLQFLGVDKNSAILVSLIPLVLGILNILTGPAFGIAALTFIVAALSALLPVKYHNGMDFASQSLGHISFDRFNDNASSSKDKSLSK